MTQAVQEQIRAAVEVGNPAIWEAAARQRLIAAADTLAQRAGLPPFDAAARTKPGRQALGDLELLAMVAEAVVALTNKGVMKR